MNKSIRQALGWYAAGVALTPVLDYVWHRWGGHDKKVGHESYTAHQEHHRTAGEYATPWAEMTSNMPLLAKTVAEINLVAAPLMGPGRSLPLSAGLLTGYALVTLYHGLMHQRAPQNEWEEWMWKFHFHHHFKNAHSNYGLTSPLFDFLLGTAEVPEEVVIPEAMKPAWFGEEHTGFRLRKKAA